VKIRRERLQRARLYLVCDERTDDFLHAALRGGVDLVQLRMKGAAEDAILAAASRFRRVCDEHGALFVVNDRPELAVAADADGVHVGQDDFPADAARRIVGRERLVGLSTHDAAQVDAAAGLAVDYIGVGPVSETPTKPGRPAVGLELVRYAATHASIPFFAIGGISASNVDAVRDAGAGRVAVVRALTEAADPEAVAHELRAALTWSGKAEVGAA
jgi:thiamine-phosphate pyrophosphorylase